MTNHVIQLTPHGRGAIATVLVEGPEAIAIVATHFRAKSGRPLQEFVGASPVFGTFGADPGEEIVVRCRTEASVELHCHGGHAAVDAITAALGEQGGEVVAWQDWAAAQEEDPIIAAARIALADARTERTAAILLDQYCGALRRSLEEIDREIDRATGEEAKGLVDELLARAGVGLHLTKPWHVVIGGEPNAGKSSLINALVGYERVIIHPTSGTTRDAVAVTTAIDGWPVELCDTAGLRESDDPLESAGIARAGERLAAADLVVLVVDGSQPWSEATEALRQAWPDALLVYNKSDLPPGTVEPEKRPEGLSTSALHGHGIDCLATAIAERLVHEPPPAGAAVPFTDEQVERLRAMKTA